MRKLFYLTTFLSLIWCLGILAMPAPITPVTLTQPDGMTFQVRIFGDEFLNWKETLDGYTIIQNPANQYYYYAEISRDGELKPSLYKVFETDQAPKNLNKHIWPTSSKIEEAAKVYESWIQKSQILSWNGSLSLGVILIEFPDKRFNKQKHTATHFYNMLFSTNYTDHPEGQPVFGSANQYYQEVSYGNAALSGDILNPNDGDDYDALEAVSVKSHYQNLGTYSDVLMDEAIQKARNAYAADPVNWKNPDAYERLCVIYAGPTFWDGALWPHTNGGRTAYIAAERADLDHNAGFEHIGVHCHEIGHLVGISDQYPNMNPGTASGDAGFWDVMGAGCWNGPNVTGSCPAHHCAYSKHKLGWLALADIESNQTVSLPTVEDNAYAISFENFVLEHRERIGFDQYLPKHPTTPIGLLIWHISGSWNILEHADNEIDWDLGDPFPGESNNTDFTPVSFPNTMGYSGIPPSGAQTIASGVSIENIELVSSSLVTADLFLNKWAGDITKIRVWNGFQYVLDDVFVKIKPSDPPPPPRLAETKMYVTTAIEDAAGLTIASNAIADLFGNIKADGGTIERQSGSVLNPDLRLMNASGIKGQYCSLAMAFGDAAASDSLFISSDTTCSGTTTFTCNAVIENSATLSFINASVVLDGFVLKASDGTISKGDNVSFSPDIRLIHNGTIKGQYPTLASAFAAAQSGDEIHLASDDTIHTVWQIPAGITFKLTNEASLVLEEKFDVLTGATFLVDPHTYIKCYDHIDIQGGTMEIETGSRLEFDHFGKLKVNGILHAEGTSSDRVIFTSHNGDWTGICFYEDTDFNASELRYCEISLADYGVWCNYTSPDVKHCLIHNNDIGFYGYYVDYHQQISDNVFEYNHDYSIAISQADEPEILRNTMTSGSSISVGMAFWDANFTMYSLIEENEIIGHSTGLNGIRSDIQLKENIISNNIRYGVLATSGTWVTMEYPGGANNVICCNGRVGVYISSSGYGIMGAYMDNAQNSIYSNANYQLEYKGDEPEDPTIEAYGNYWGGCPVNPSWIYGNVDYSDPFCSDPNATLSAPNPNIARTDAAEPVLPVETTSTNDSIATAKKAAFQFVARHDLNSAIEQFKWIADNFPETEDASHALVHLNHCYKRLKEKSGLESYLESVCAKNRENDLVLTARYLLAPDRILRGERKESLQTYLAISRQTKNAELAADALFNAWQVCFNLLQDIPQAKGIYQTFAENYGKDNRLIILQLAHAAEDHEKLMRTDEPVADLAKPSTESPEPAPAVITEYRLYPNYPNPFNPHTTIGYQLPEAGMVSLKIYNLAGKLVRTLVQSSQTAAYHQVQWNATDDAGNPVAAGIYLCQMQADVFRQTQRLVLLK